jgi:hypothetical protein
MTSRARGLRAGTTLHITANKRRLSRYLFDHLRSLLPPNAQCRTTTRYDNISVHENRWCAAT